jgi:hypothetical protein
VLSTSQTAVAIGMRGWDMSGLQKKVRPPFKGGRIWRVP